MDKKNLLERSVSLYVVFVVLLVSLIGAVLFGASVRHVFKGNKHLGSFGEVLLVIAEYPSLVIRTLNELEKDSRLIVEDTRFSTLDGFEKNGEAPFGAKNDEGYLLLSSYNDEKEQPTVQLIRVADQQVIYEWSPDIDKLAEFDKIKNRYDAEVLKSGFMYHPLLLNDGGIVFKGGEQAPLFKIDACSAVTIGLDGTFHHSTEVDEGGNYWTPSVMYPSSFEGVLNHRDDAIAQVSPVGEVLFEKSVAEILYENGYRGLLAAGGFGEDPIHLNDIQPALTDSPYWEKGDLMMSMPLLNTIMLYRPSTNKIIWLKTGPWMMQHDVNFVGDHELSVFGNNIILNPGRLPFADSKRVAPKYHLMDGHNDVYRYDFQTDQITTPYNNIMKSMEVSTFNEGRAIILDNGDVVVEETDNGRILRMHSNGVKWEFVRRIDETYISALGWSRYLTEKEVAPALKTLMNTPCE